MPDTHAYKITESKSVHSLLAVNGEGFSEALKLSNLHNVRVDRATLIGGYEDCIDIVRGCDHDFRQIALVAGKRTKQYITVKGGAYGINFNDVVLQGRRKGWWDIVIGDWTIYDGEDPNHPPCTAIIFTRLRRLDGKKVRILVLHADQVICTSKNVSIIRVPKWVVRIYFRIMSKFNKRRP